MSSIQACTLLMLKPGQCRCLRGFIFSFDSLILTLVVQKDFLSSSACVHAEEFHAAVSEPCFRFSCGTSTIGKSPTYSIDRASLVVAGWTSPSAIANHIVCSTFVRTILSLFLLQLVAAILFPATFKAKAFNYWITLDASRGQLKLWQFLLLLTFIEYFTMEMHLLLDKLELSIHPLCFASVYALQLELDVDLKVRGVLWSLYPCHFQGYTRHCWLAPV